MRLGKATWAAGLISMAILVVLSAAIAGGKLPRLIAKMAISAILTAALVGALFIVKFPASMASRSRAASRCSAPRWCSGSRPRS